MLLTNKLKFNILSPEDYNSNIMTEPHLEVFSDIIVDFISELSTKILRNKKYKQYPEIMALAFWMRKRKLLQLKKEFNNNNNNNIYKKPIGLVFHIAPSNVDTIFIYSWFLSMLVGNINILKVSSKDKKEVEILIEEINNLLSKDKYKKIKDKFLIVQYKNQTKITKYFSDMCDMRVVWGGDLTINAVRDIILPPMSKELVFPDRFSYSIISASEFNSFKNQNDLVEKFLKDVYSFDQNACSSPRIIFWFGDEIESQKAREKFWDIAEEEVSDNFFYEFHPSNIMDKLVIEDSLAIECEKLEIESTKNNLINRILFDNINDLDRNKHNGGGLFYEYILSDFKELESFINAKDQTLSYFGFEKKTLFDFMKNKRKNGINRIVPIGQTNQFSHIWDGYQLLNEFSTQIEIL